MPLALTDQIIVDLPPDGTSFIRAINDCRRTGQIAAILEKARVLRLSIMSPDHSAGDTR
jgi:ribosomal protein S14